MKTKKRVGVVRDCYYQYSQIKQAIIDKKISLNDSAGLMTEKANKDLIENNNSFDKSLGDINLPPNYIEKFDMCNDIMREIDIKFNRLKELQQRRLVPKFDDNENKKLDREIRSTMSDMTAKLKKCEDNIKIIVNEKTESAIEEQIKTNMKQSISSRLIEITKQLKLNQEEYMSKYKDLFGNDYSADSLNDSSMRNKENTGINDSTNKNNFLVTEEKNDVLQKRDQDITLILNSIKELAEIFKDLNTLVMEQGTILDRIDYNISAAADNVEIGKNSLIKAEKNVKSNCSRNAILVLIILNFVLATMLVFKFIK